MNGTIGILVACLIVTVILVLFTANVGLTATMSEDWGDTLENPTAWDVLTFNGTVYLELMAFGIPGMPVVISTALWLLTFIEVICIVFLVRGVS